MHIREEWEDLYLAAVKETDFTKMEERVRAVEIAVDQRLKVLSCDHAGTPEEQQALVNALQRVSVLRADAARWRTSSSTDGQ